MELADNGTSQLEAAAPRHLAPNAAAIGPFGTAQDAASAAVLTRRKRRRYLSRGEPESLYTHGTVAHNSTSTHEARSLHFFRGMSRLWSVSMYRRGAEDDGVLSIQLCMRSLLRGLATWTSHIRFLADTMFLFVAGSKPPDLKRTVSDIAAGLTVLQIFQACSHSDCGDRHSVAGFDTRLDARKLAKLPSTAVSASASSCVIWAGYRL